MRQIADTLASLAIGIQHHLLAELFLVSFDPKIPRMGAQRKEAAKRINVSLMQCAAVWPYTSQVLRMIRPISANAMQLQERIRSLVRRMCGIGLCNQWTPPSLFTACMAIAACKYFSSGTVSSLMFNPKIHIPALWDQAHR